ncbi:hypothetical protein M430DRAFT_49937 [Amorphotheca resinae ATCC 22711]|jgi:hypothetical protein|uniref:Uncharacterized protein n=1 Tax=Amorphotheca resinae ATCC 22711 TaxID=857342 RepID=A0A2T3B3Q0_AMORE|nr:hypothetical protein M430DRAFT_49937 [Amorphotheca resinae ATCC 22711]PSS20257.1 hypothetical protein M430DRAFT_49937 [Amorphotheca resinae ATCC 22711]
MAQYHRFKEDREQCERIDQWECLKCFKTTSASRPPVFNPDNCSCAEAGSLAAGIGGPPQATAFDQARYPCESPGAACHYAAQSYASSSVSAKCPEGPERELPDIEVADSIGSESGLSEVQHRRSVSAPSDMSFQMRRFLFEQDYDQSSCIVEPASSEMRFLQQDIFIQSENTQKKKSEKSKQTYQSMLSSMSSDEYFVGCDVDPMSGVGSWDDGGGYVCCGEGYPLSMSGLVEDLSE